jgi:hypothetical protein
VTARVATPLPVIPKKNAAATEELFPDGVHLRDFWAYMPTHAYIFAPTGDMWPAASVNARIPPVEEPTGTLKASAWLDQYQPVEQITWAPGQPRLILDRLISQGGWIERANCSCFNLYRPPQIRLGDASLARRWVNHARAIFGEQADHIIKWLAHRVQRPFEKINHALVLGGGQGIGKDTLLAPAREAVGPWNFVEVSPGHMQGRFNGFVKSVILLISEARDLGDVDRYKFYEHTKIYTAAPPDTLRCDEKNLREYTVPNVCGVVITTNHKTDGIYLPADDRRHYVAWSDLRKEDINPEYFNDLYAWYHREGNRHVAAYLATLDLSTFDAKAPPPKTAAFQEIVDANRAPEDAELEDVLSALGNPDATTLIELSDRASGTFADWLRDRRNSRQIPHRLESAGYVPLRNDAAKSGLWVVAGKRQVVYVRGDLTIHDRIVAARGIVEASR